MAGSSGRERPSRGARAQAAEEALGGVAAELHATREKPDSTQADVARAQGGVASLQPQVDTDSAQCREMREALNAAQERFTREIMLREHGQNAHRGRSKAPKAVRPPTTHIATAPRQVWCWDTTYLPAIVLGRWFHLYLILDLYSRKIVGWEVHDSDDSDHAVRLVRRTALAEGIATMGTKPVLHGDNGSTLKATTVLAMLNWLGAKPSYSRPRVSDDNA